MSGDDADARAIVFEPEFARLLQTAARFTIAFTQIVSEVQPPTLRPLIHLDHDLPLTSRTESSVPGLHGGCCRRARWSATPGRPADRRWPSRGRVEWEGGHCPVGAG